MHLCKLATVATVAMVLSVSAVAQDNYFQVGIAPGNLANAANTVVHLSNSGASWGLTMPYTLPQFPFDIIGSRNTGPTGAGLTLVGNGNLCVNAYVFSQDEQLQACCSCGVTPNAYRRWTVAQLISNPLTGIFNGNDSVIKLISTNNNNLVTGVLPNCTAPIPFTQQPTATATAASAGFGSNVIAPGLLAWMGYPNGSITPFTNAALSTYELNRAVNLCANIYLNGSGRGICPACTTATP